MRILVHDFAGHPYAVQLSRACARLGHDVMHVYSGSNPMPQGTLVRLPEDPPGLVLKSVLLDSRIDKSKLLKRRQQDIEHGVQVGEVIEEFNPDVLISGSTPLDTQLRIWQACEQRGIPRVFWLQDLTGVAISGILRRRLPVLGNVIGNHYLRLEERLLRSSSGVISISEDFTSWLMDRGVTFDRLHVVENWGPIEELPVEDKSNAWSRQHGLQDTFNFVYSGSLGMKHDPQLLLNLALAMKDEPSVRIVIVSEGIGRRWLEDKRKELAVSNLILLDFQPYDSVPQVMGSADVLMVVLEPLAGAYSVPSKALSCLCAQRPLLLSVPNDNLVARTIEEIRAGLNSEPGADEEFIANANRLYRDAELRDQMGRAGRAYAESSFGIESIARRFIEIFEHSVRVKII